MVPESTRAGWRSRFEADLIAQWPAALALLAACLCLLLAAFIARPVPLVLELDAEIATSADGQLFHSREGGYSEDRSQRFAIDVDARRVYRIELDDLRPTSLRLDPGSAPGRIVLHEVRFQRGGREVRLGPAELASAVKPIGGMQIGTAGDGLPVVAVNADPHFELEVPEDLRNPARGSKSLVVFLLAAALGLAWWSRGVARVAATWIYSRHRVLVGLLVGVAGTLVLLRLTGIGMVGDRPLQSLIAGTALMFAVVAFSVVGQVALRAMPGWSSAAGFPVQAIVGQALLFCYVYVRSLPGAFGLPLPVTRYEIVALVVVAAVVLFRNRSSAPALTAERELGTFHLAIIYLLCVVVADRELPRLVMLSSDPDVHAFLGNQVVRFGGVPWQQGNWGEESFNYPAGTGVLIALWAWISQLDVRNAVSALSFITYPLGMLALASCASQREHIGLRMAAAFLALALLFSAYMLPLYGNYVHMEGLGRIVGFAFLAALAAMVVGVCRRGHAALAASAICAALVFALVCLNPVNFAGAGLLVGLGVVWLLAGGRWKAAATLGASLSAILLVFVDPYFFGMLTGGAASEKVALEGFSQVELGDGVRQGLHELLARPLFHLGSAVEIMPGAPRPASVLLVGVPVVAWACILDRRDLWRLAACSFAFVGVSAAALAVAHQFAADQRFFLLAPYLQVSLAQLKIIIVVALSVVMVMRVARSGRVAASIALAMVMIFASASVVGSGANFFLTPKKDYCGGVECPAADDIAVLQMLREHLDGSGTDPQERQDRLLIANRIVRLGGETWLFPSGAGRLAPYAGVGPVAFFYYQGDPDYTTRNYVAHVCERFDLAWLREQHVRYVLIPATPGDWCIHDHEGIASRWETVVSSGNAKVIDITRSTE
ncbi:hypothetical protein E5843_03550 [Luteimonas yindakuii]|uniref:hypothetical protein n=1 Tax=Luteimonas yindakuii TaxID=2565782 RepID=UPI0011077599|nr:hypothetical protein [Luteimonas yindakuii]QCO67084.2 hypothetical protein E5843_03550 [Luteimonas yindakuii]